jgi:transglutaminase-like putative cysteine protease
MSTYRVTHRTMYHYGTAVSSAHLLVALAPRELTHQHPINFAVECSPAASYRAESIDAHGNAVIHLSIARPHDALSVTGHSEVRVNGNRPQLPSSVGWSDAVRAIAGDRSPEGLAARDYRLPSKHVPLSDDVVDYARPSFARHEAARDALLDLSRRIFTEFTFSPGFSDVATPLSEVLRHARGVCQDFAHLYIACVRSMGLPARYVSGYIETDPPPGELRLQGADASHAWCAVYVAPFGWIDVDPTNNVLPSQRHIVIGWGRDYADIAPIRGVLVGPPTTQRVEVAVDVQKTGSVDCPAGPAALFLGSLLDR